MRVWSNLCTEYLKKNKRAIGWQIVELNIEFKIMKESFAKTTTIIPGDCVHSKGHIHQRATSETHTVRGGSG